MEELSICTNGRQGILDSACEAATRTKLGGGDDVAWGTWRILLCKASNCGKHGACKPTAAEGHKDGAGILYDLQLEVVVLKHLVLVSQELIHADWSLKERTFVQTGVPELQEL